MSCEQHHQQQRHMHHQQQHQQQHHPHEHYQSRPYQCRQQQLQKPKCAHQQYSQYQEHHQQHLSCYTQQPHHQYQLWFIISAILFLIDISNSLTMTEVKIPNHIMRFKSAVLGCRYNLDGESLYSVKWYKDGHEFYRYVPRDKPPGQAFPLPGVNVDVRNSTDTKVTLRRVTLMSTGVYKCEVSGEAPAFNTVSESETMTVVMTPNHGPKVTGGRLSYQIGDVIRMNCTSGPSKPVCHLSWFINGEPANRSYLKQYEKYVVGREGLEMARLGLEFRVKGIHFQDGEIKMKCVAKISSLYWQSNEASVQSDRQHRAPALESRETIAAKSRAHGSSSAKPRSHTTLQQLHLATLLSLLTAFCTSSYSISLR
ncbi:uncharacterized protein LOC126753252 isoform X3 [Bactrocera neohumeralis]|uniref:uncharacterized protein LOC126753252 isoform X3 n=2 Tax=Bactrocera tyroni species complex TaxID=98808 RepID=UPI0021656781|nr:uncharacterized protein LOC126753252 isoform X3 [Bactrocera neohumeralis]